MSDEQKNGDGKGFTVRDRRGLDADGEPRDTGEQEQAAEEKRELPPLDFSTFILSLSTSAMVHLGEAPHPEGAERRDLVLARQTIDILGILRDKTAGNLTAEEDKLLDELLYDLRLRYVQAQK